jgi:histidinol-phosphate phosphatase family protein
VIARPDAVFLDRDGTIIEDAHYIKAPSQVRLLPGAAGAIKRLNDAGVRVIVATNQSGIARGLFTVEEYQAVSRRLDGLLAAEGAHIDASYYCPHHPNETGPCSCRKPGTKMFEDALRDWRLDPARVAYIGDRWRDVAASKKLGGRGIMVDSPMTTDEDRRLTQQDGIETADTLDEAIEMLFGLTQRDASA